MWHRSRIAWIAVAVAALLAAGRLAAEGSRLFAAPAASPAADAGWVQRAREFAPTTAPHEHASPGASSAGGEGAMGAPAAGAASAAARGASPADLTAAAGGAAPARSAPRIELDPLELDPESGTATPTGFDPLAPRALLLWRVVEGRSAVMARGASARDGALEFPRVIVPRDGIEVVVSPEGLDPAALDASLPRSVEPGRPAAPHGEIVASAPGRWSLRVRASEAVGEILIAGVDGEIFARQALPPQPTPGRRTFDLRIEVPATDPHLWLAHALPDGRRSEWRRAAPFPAAAPEAP